MSSGLYHFITKSAFCKRAPGRTSRTEGAVTSTEISACERATGEIRTRDLSFTKASLCQLSYGGHWIAAVP